MKNYIPILKTVPLFYDIEDHEMNSLLACLSAKVMRYHANEPIFLAGDAPCFVGIVLSGEVQVTQDDYFGNRNIIASVSQGQLFGEAFACADIKSLPVSVFATTQSDIMLVNYKKIITTCSNSCSFHNKLIYNMLRVVAHKNIMLSQKIEFISKRNTKDKLLAYLSNEANKAGTNCFSIPFNRQELADYLTVDRSAMSNELCKMRDQGILSFHKNQFTLFL